jgi:hypothetical protein
METEFILICATGRSGSTTLQRIINTIPNVNIKGENNNAILHLLEFYKSIKFNLINNNSYSTFLNQNTKPCWYNDFNKEEIVNQITSLILSFLNKNNTYKIVGFKEIRYNDKNIHLLNEFKELFPKTKFIFHIRNPEKQCKSNWWGKDIEKSKKELYEINEAFYKFYQQSDFKNDIHLSCFKYLFDFNKLREIFKFLNKEEYFNRELIENILNNNQN